MNWRILSVLCLSVFASTLGQGLVVPLLPGYAQSMGASGFMIGLIFGMFAISRAIFLPYFGYLSDSRGRKPFITWGLFFYLCASLAFILFHNVTALIIIRFFQGISSAMILPVAQAYAAEISPMGKEGKTMGYINISVFSGLSAGPLFGGVIKDAAGIEASFTSMGIVCAIGFLLCFLLLPSKRSVNPGRKDTYPFSVFGVVKNKNVLGVFLIRFGYIFCVGTLWAFLPIVAEADYNMSSTFVGLILTLVVFTNAILSIPVGVLSDHTSKRVLVVFGGVLNIAGIVLIYNASKNWELYLVAVLIGIGGGFLTPATTAMSAVIGKNLKSIGTVMSMLNMGQSLGMFVGPLVAGLIMDQASLNTAFLFSGITFSILLFAGMVLSRNYRLIELNSRF